MSRVSSRSAIIVFSGTSAVSALALILSASVSDARLPEFNRVDPQNKAQQSAQTDLLRYAQVGGTPIGADESGEGEGATGTSVGKSVSVTPAQTQSIVADIEPGGSVCEDTPSNYRLDCIAKSFRDAARKMPRNGEYAEARATLNQAADKLDALVKKERDRTKPRIRVRKSTAAASKSTKPLTAVKAERVAAVNAQAVPIIAEAETILLRTAASDAKRAVHYQRIAAAVGSNKVLLRSS